MKSVCCVDFQFFFLNFRSKHAGGVEEKVDEGSESEVENKEEAEEHGHTYNKQPIKSKTNTDSADN